MIKFSQVEHMYSNNVYALKNINIEINQGEFVFLVGASGAGKSTIIKLLLKEVEPSKGEIEINNKKIKNISKRQIPYYRRKIGVVFQDFRLIPTLNIYENIEFALRITKTEKRIIKKRVHEVLNLVGLYNKNKMYPNEISGGEQQRVALARALVNNPKIIIADEPTGNLDPENSYEIIDLLKEINNRGTTIIVATHDKNIVDSMKKRVITLENGNIIRDKIKGVYNLC